MRHSSWSPHGVQYTFPPQLFLSWIYWDDIGLQKHTGLKCTTQQNIFTSPRAPFAPNSLFRSPFSLPLPTSTCPHAHFPLAVTTWLSVSMCFLTKTFTFFHPAPPPLWQMAVRSMHPSLCFSSVHCLFSCLWLGLMSGVMGVMLTGLQWPTESMPKSNSVSGRKNFSFTLLGSACWSKS